MTERLESISTEQLEPLSPGLVPWSPRRTARFVRQCSAVLGRAALALAALGAFAGLVAFFYVVSLHATAGNSDGATVVLEGQAMAAGNLALHGWHLTLDSFWSVEDPFYAIGVLVVGLKPVLLHVVPALLAAVVVAVGVLMARRGARGAAGIAGALTAFVLLGLPSHSLGYAFLQGALHVGTILWCLLAFAALSRGGSRRGWLVAAVIFAAGSLGDLEIVALGMVPALAAGVVAVGRTRRFRQGAPAVGAVVAGGALAVVARLIAAQFGAFHLVGGQPMAPAARWPVNAARVVPDLAHILGVGGGLLGAAGMPAILQVVRIVGVMGLLAGVAFFAWAMVRGLLAGRGRESAEDDGWRLDDLLLFAFVADVGVFSVLALNVDPGFYRELTAGVVFGGILAGRSVVLLVRRLPPAVTLRRSVLAGAVVVTALFAASTGFTLATPAPQNQSVALGQFLRSHGLVRGVGGYWSAAITTVSTRGAVTLRPVEANQADQIRAYRDQDNATWYAHDNYDFLVYDTAVNTFRISARSAAVSFGPPARAYRVGDYRVLVWHRPFTVDGPSQTRPALMP